MLFKWYFKIIIKTPLFYHFHNFKRNNEFNLTYIVFNLKLLGLCCFPENLNEGKEIERKNISKIN